MDRIELASQLITKGVELLDESAGRNGYNERKFRVKYEMEKAKNDARDAKVEKKREQYKRAGYEDMVPKKANRDNEEHFKSLADENHNIRHDPTNINEIDRDFPQVIADQSKNSVKEALEYHNNLTNKQKALHGRINKRGTKSQNEAVADLLTEAAYLLSLVNNDD